MSGVSVLDRYPGQVNVLMLKKAMEVQKAAAAAVLATMDAAQAVNPAPVRPSHLGQKIDIRL